MEAIFVIAVTPAGKGSTTLTTKAAAPLPPLPLSAPTAYVHVLPALLFGVHAHPTPLKVVLTGTVSVITTPATA
jgi:hypothetical protein